MSGSLGLSVCAQQRQQLYILQFLYAEMRVLIAFIFILQTLLQVSWVRHRDIHLLTVGRYTYTSDQRFKAIHHAHSEDWILQIKYPQHRDSGIYECQVMILLHLLLIRGNVSGQTLGWFKPVCMYSSMVSMEIEAA